MTTRIDATQCAYCQYQQIHRLAQEEMKTIRQVTVRPAPEPLGGYDVYVHGKHANIAPRHWVTWFQVIPTRCQCMKEEMA